MNIDNLISSFDADKIKSDCLIHEFLRTYNKRKTNLSSCDDNEADVLRVQNTPIAEFTGSMMAPNVAIVQLK